MKKQFFTYLILSLSVAIVYSCNLTKNSDTGQESEMEVEIADELSTLKDSLDSVVIDTDLILKDNWPFIVYERGYCFGMCPVFKSSISHEGLVSYEGINFVDNMGTNIATLTDEQMQALESKIFEINYFEMDSVYNNEMISDLPSVNTKVQIENNQNKVLDRWKSPKELKDLYTLLDEIYASLEWVPANETE